MAFAMFVLFATFSPQTSLSAQLFGLKLLDSTTQHELNKWIRANGSASVFSELYLTGNGANARRPPATIRANIQTTFTILDQISVPFELMLSTENVSFRQPFNQFGFSPQLGKNVRLSVGYHNISYSQYSVGDVRLLGGGADVKIGNFRIQANAGESQRPALPDSATFFAGSLARMLLAGRIAYESDSGAVFGLNVVRARDDAASLTVPPERQSRIPRFLEAQDNLVASIDARFPLFSQKVLVEGEVAAARNGGLWAQLIGAECGFGSSGGIVSADNLRLDYAARLNISYDASSDALPISFRFRAEYIGPGYISLGYAQLPNDRLETDIAPTLRLFDNKLTLSGSIGYSVNNLLGDRITTAQRVIGSANISAQITDWFGIDAQYQNYGIRVAPPPNFSIVQPMQPITQLQTQQVFGFISLMPRAFFKLGEYNQNVSFIASVQQFADANAETRRFTENSSQMYRLLWSSQIQKLTLTINLSQMSNQSAFAQFAATEASVTAAHPFFENKLTPALTLGWTKTTESSGLDSRFSSTLRANYRLTKETDVVLAMQANYYSYKPGSRSPSYAEGQMSLEIRQRF